MDCTNIDDDKELFKEICLDSDSDEEVSSFKSAEFIRRTLPRPRPLPPPEPPIKYMEKIGDFEKHIQEKCNNLLQIVDRSTFHRIKRPIIIFFNHFRELFYHHSKWLDIFRRVALKFADRIEFIAGDQRDVDLIHPYVNPLNFFSCFIRPQDEDPTVFAIDENKQIFEYFNIHKTEENLCELCENLLNGSLYASQPIPDKQEHLVKIAVHHNYNVLVTNSTKDTFLIVGLGDYQPHQENEPDYEQVAEELKDSNIQLVYIDGDKNYIPFEFYANCYPTLIFISHKDKRDFIHYDREPRDTENILKFLNENICPLGKSWRSEQHLALQYRAFTLPTDKDLHFEDLNEYLSEHFPKSLKVFNRNTFGTLNNSIIIYFMDFKDHGLPHYISSLQKLCQVAQAYHGFGIEYLIADLQDLDVLYPIWYEKYIKDLELDKTIPHIYAIDRMENTYKLEEFKTAVSLFYYSCRLNDTGFFHKQLRIVSDNSSSSLVKSRVANNLKPLIQQSKQDIFLTIYWGTYKESFEILNILEEVALGTSNLDIKLYKMDAKLNLVPLEYNHSIYPEHFFIPTTMYNFDIPIYQQIEM